MKHFYNDPLFTSNLNTRIKEYKENSDPFPVLKEFIEQDMYTQTYTHY